MTTPLAAIALTSTALAAGLAADPSLGQTAQGMQWGGSAGPVFPPQVSGTNATLAADFVGNQYWAAAASQAGFAAWLTAIGGTFTRAGPATYIDGGVLKTAASGVPRFGSFGLRMTGAATPLVLQTNGFTTSPWTNVQGSFVQNAIGPDGIANSAWTVTSAAACNVRQPVTPSGATVQSWFVKQGTEGFAFLRASDSGGGIKITWFNLATGAVATTNLTTAGTPTFNQTNPQVMPLANGWFLISLVNSGPITQVMHGFCTNDAATVATAGNTSFAFGAQLTQTTMLCDYIPTTTAAVAQAADQLSWPYSQTTFSVLVGTNGLAPTTGPGMVQVGDAGGNGYIYLGAGQFFTWNSTSALGSANYAGTSYTPHKIMSAGSPSGRAITLDGLSPGTDANIFVLGSAVGTLTVGYYSSPDVQPMYGNISQLALWNGIVASAAEMQRLTT